MDEQAAREQVQVLQKMQENLQALQKNGEQLTATLLAQQAQGPAPKTERDKLQAAYALNLCTVSVSQIIDYNDVNFLEREYEAILNNLNLEHMPKDEALLHILKQLLDVITYFRISEGEKELLEKEYQQQMKDAIWSAVPNIGVIAAGGNPVSLAISLASQVGIGYMNYRREKARNSLAHDRQEWELQRSALEQFNGLRRELFDTAWRLADEYNFPDEYRLTERQITQYDHILLDLDPVRKYERLSFVQDKFQAYPPYWYYLGNAVNSVYQDASQPQELREQYKTYAKNAFNTFLKRTEYNLLREDQLEASCALELFDLVDEPAEKATLLERAKKASGDAFDVLQLCAMSYLSLGDIQNAAALLRHLVNEDYNTQVNAQLLSRLYVAQTIRGIDCRGEYQLLQGRAIGTVLFPMPEDIPQSDAAREALEKDFLRQQKNLLKQVYAWTVKEFILKYGAAYGALCKENGNIVEKMACLLKSMDEAVPKLFTGTDRRASLFAERIQYRIDAMGERFRAMLEASARDAKSTIRFDELTRSAFEELTLQIGRAIDRMTGMEDISRAETALEEFCRLYELSVAEDREQELRQQSGEDLTAVEIIFGKSYKLQRLQYEQIRAFKEVFRKEEYQEKNIFKQSKDGTPDKIAFFCSDNPRFKSYCTEHAALLEALDSIALNGLSMQNSIIAVLNDEKMWDKDILFTTTSVIVVTTAGHQAARQKAAGTGGMAGTAAGMAAGMAAAPAATLAGGGILAAATPLFMLAPVIGLTAAAVTTALRSKPALKNVKAVCQYKDIQKRDDTSLQMRDYVYKESRLHMDVFLHLTQELAGIAKHYEKIACADSPVIQMAYEIAKQIEND